jgi:hypothetical protein
VGYPVKKIFFRVTKSVSILLNSKLVKVYAVRIDGRVLFYSATDNAEMSDKLNK